MTKLVSTYARSTGLKIDRPNLKEHFYPLPFDRYITIQTGSGQAAKNYDLFQEVINLVKPLLDVNRISIVHLGAKDDPPLLHTHDLRGKTSFLQSNYLIKRTLTHVGNDSWLAHCAGWNKCPLVALYGNTSIANHGPYWYNQEKTILLESHRGGGVPTYVANESPKTVNMIPPERVANAILTLLGINHPFTRQTHFIGGFSQHFILDLIPNAVPVPTMLPQVPMTVRMDYHFDEGVLGQTLGTGRKVNIVTNRPIDLNLLAQFRAQILSYNHELTSVDNTPIEYADNIKALFPTSHVFFTRVTDGKQMSDLRFKYFDHVTITQQRDSTKDDYIRDTLVYLNLKDTPENRVDIERKLGDTWFKTQKFILSNGGCYVSYPHLVANKPITDLSQNTALVVDDPTLWRDLQHLYIYHQP